MSKTSVNCDWIDSNAENFEDNDNIKLSIQHSGKGATKYGQIPMLNGDIKFLLPWGKYPVPKYFLESTESKKEVVDKFIERLKHFYEDFTDKQIAEKIFGLFITAQLYVPNYNPKSPLVQYLTDLESTIVNVYDYLEVEEDFDQMNFETVALRWPLMEGMSKGNLNEMNKFGRAFPVFDKQCEHTVKAHQDLKNADVANYSDVLSTFAITSYNSWTTIPLLFECMGSVGFSRTYSPYSINIIKGTNIRLKNTLELICAFEGLNINKFRSMLIFQILVDSFTICSGLMSDMINFQSNLKNEQLVHSILGRKILVDNCSVNDAWEYGQKMLDSYHKDLKLAITQLRENFANTDNDLEKYLQIVEFLYDGTLYSYYLLQNATYENSKFIICKL